MSDANRVSVSYIAESTYATTPATPTMQTLRMTGESLKRTATYTDSQEIRDDRQTAYTVLTDVSGGGDINGEVSYGTYDDFFMGTFQASAWASAVTQNNVANVTAAAAGTTFTRAAGSWITDGFLVGKWVRITGGVTNSGTLYGKITNLSATVMTLSGLTIADEGPISTFDFVQGAYIENGVTATSFSMEKTFGDVASNFEVYTGAMPGDFAINATAGGILTCKFGFLSKSPTHGTSTIANALTAATTTSVMNAVTNVAAILENGSSFGVRDLGFTYNNNLRERKQIATLGAVSIGSGSISINGTMTVYHSSGASTVYQKFLNDTVSSFALRLVDNAGNAYILDTPNIKFTQGSRNATGINTDVVVPLEFRATIHSSELKSARLQRWAA